MIVIVRAVLAVVSHLPQQDEAGHGQKPQRYAAGQSVQDHLAPAVVHGDGTQQQQQQMLLYQAPDG
jgi:hypothetical protein